MNFLENYFGCTFTATEGGEIVTFRLRPDLEGSCFLDLAADQENRDRWRAAFERCYAFGEEMRLRVTVDDDGKLFECACKLECVTGHALVMLEILVFHDFSQLTQKEKSVLRWSAYEVERIAAALNMKPSTVRSHRHKIRKKLKLSPDDELLWAAAALALEEPQIGPSRAG